jgi:ABC-type transporter MlaC component
VGDPRQTARPRGVCRHAAIGVLAALLAGLLGGGAWGAPAASPGGPLERTREVLTASNRIVTGTADQNQKLAELKDLLRGFLDTDALARRAMGKHLDGEPQAQVDEFFGVFRELFVRTYVQRLLLFDAPDFEYLGEKVEGDTATVRTQIVTPKDEFAVDYRLRHTQQGWIATDVLVEEVSLAENFRAQFDKALSKASFADLLQKLQNKLSNKPNVDV